MITEVHDNVVFYEYTVRGVVYTASQDVSKLREHIPIDPDRLMAGRNEVLNPKSRQLDPRLRAMVRLAAGNFPTPECLTGRGDGTDL